ncbi:MAG: helix-turn-helix transcriptional regulator [Nitrospinota bacterium]
MDLDNKIKDIEDEVKNLEVENWAKDKIVKLLENNQSVLETNLEEKNKELQRKNIALAEILNQLEKEKEKIKLNIQANVDHIILPLLTKIKSQNLIIDENYLKLLEEAFSNLASEFGVELSRIEPKLSQKEMEICHMIRSGLSTKDIATGLNISDRTVETHRTNIRKKLKLSNKNVNLSNFLKNP